MKANQAYLPILVVALAACSGHKEQQNNTSPTTQTQKTQDDKLRSAQLENKLKKTLTKIQQLQKEASEDSNFIPLDLSKVEVTNKPLSGNFPYFVAPDGYLYSTSKGRRSSLKYFFSQSGKLISVQGMYFIGNLFPKKETIENTEWVINFYAKAITAAGGEKIFDGKAPGSLANQYSKIAPPEYWRDMYNPLGAHFTQYLINQPNKAIWIEIATNPGSQRMDISVIQTAKSTQKTAK